MTNTRPTKQQMNSRAFDVLAEQSQTFEIEGEDGKPKQYRLYPLQLARLALISKRLIELDLVFEDDNTDAVHAMWQICSTKPRQVAEIIAIATLRTRGEVETQLEARTNELLWSPTMTPEAYTNILYTIISQSYYEDFMKGIRLVKIISVNISQADDEKRIPTAAIASGDR